MLNGDAEEQTFFTVSYRVSLSKLSFSGTVKCIVNYGRQRVRFSFVSIFCPLSGPFLVAGSVVTAGGWRVIIKKKKRGEVDSSWKGRK